jgi:hypothetical protein
VKTLLVLEAMRSFPNSHQHEDGAEDVKAGERDD